MVMVVGVDVIVILLVSQVLLVAQLAVETGVSILLWQDTKRQHGLNWTSEMHTAQLKQRKENQVKNCQPIVEVATLPDSFQSKALLPLCSSK